MAQRIRHLEDFAHLAEETQMLAHCVQEVRLRMAAGRRRVDSSSDLPAAPVDEEAAAGAAGAATERPSRPAPVPAAERPSCLANVSKWLPPLAPTPHTLDSSARAAARQAGRYSIIGPRKR